MSRITKTVLALLLAVALFIPMAGVAESDVFSGKSRMNADGTGLDVEYGQIEKQELTEPVTFKILRDWNGSSSTEPLAEVDIVAPVLKEKFGVTIEWEFCVGSETEKLTLVFASGDLPNFIDFPFWGGAGGETGVIRKAQRDGMLRPVDGYIETYAPTVADKMYRNASQKYIQKELESEVNDGYHYFIPRETMYNPEEDTINWLYGVYIRKDIAEAVGFDYTKDCISNYEELTELMEKIAAGGFKDINGNDVIVASTGSRGFAWEYYHRYMEQAWPTDLHYIEESGLYRWREMDKEFQYERLENMRQWVEKRYLDSEAFTQENVTVETKLNNGSVALISNQGLSLITTTTEFYANYPEMEYVPLPIANIDGEVYTGLYATGRDGTPAWCVTEDTTDEQLIAFLTVMEYLNSTEGQTLITYGIEGETFTYVDGKPQYLPEYEEAASTDMRKLTEMGIAGGTGSGEISAYGIFVVADTKPFKSDEAVTAADKRADAYEKIIPIKWKEGNSIQIDFWNNDYDADKLSEWQMAKDDFNKVIQSAMFASTAEEGRAILDEWYSSVEPLYEKYEAFINEKINSYDGYLVGRVN